MLSALAFLLGLCFGSFTNVVVVRLAAGEKISGRSHCRSCGRQLAWYHNIPLLSFIWLKGCCAWCQQKISWQYPAVELAAGLLFALGVYLMPSGDWLWLTTYLVLSVYGLTLFVFDFKYKVLPDALTLSGAAVLGILNFWRGQPLEQLLLAAVIAAGFFALQYLISQGKWLGSGDIRLGLFMGLALGWPQVVTALAIAYWLGALVGVGLIILRHYSLKSELAFGTFLTASTVAVFLWGEKMVEWYWGLIS